MPRGGGTGFAAGAVPLDGGVVLGLERMTRVRAFEPLLWRICVEAGLSTAEVRRLARENGLFFPPDPGAAEQSQIGGNVATNAGGPHAFKYGVTGAWVTGLEAVVPPGEIVADRRSDPQGRGRLRPEEPPDRLRGNAWRDHRGLAQAPAGTRGGAARGRLPRRRRGGLPGDRGRAGRGPDRGGARVPGRRRPGRGRRLVPGRRSPRRRLHGDRRGRRRRGRGRAPSARAGGGPGHRARSPCERPPSDARWRRCGDGATASRSRSRPGAEGR